MKTEAAGLPVVTTRIAAIDNLRVVLTALVVAHHAAVTYSHIPLWYYNEPAKDPSAVGLDILITVNQAFFMGFFFLISGFFTPGSYDRKGAGPFLRDRLIRLGIPLLAYLLLLRPLVELGIYAEHRDVPYWRFYLATWDPGPMWFVEVLIVLALAYAGWRALRAPLAARPAPLRLWQVALFTLGLAVVWSLWRIAVPTGTYVPVLGLPTPDFLPQYAAMFVLGCVAWRRGWFETLPRRAIPVAFTAAGVATLALLPLVTGGGPLAQPALSLWHAVFSVSVIIGLTVWFRERWNRQGPRGRFLSRNAYTVYITHPLVLVALGWALRGLAAPAAVKFAVMLVLALPLCWGLAALVRRLPGAGRVL
ncbi:acyltransferase family protein [Actinomadura sp. ATCC 31491]|uniref:Acyltransferase family protein n=1 Tax=Actinomadura luzonensis TaxID=2805427 RepID=A0ABT0G2P7_9ACTN|nr:acyltransferase family protein [Actinomadura luzonensis]MCK2218873.1 acyltransferase family protein [Actinomadura luzonensis]